MKIHNLFLIAISALTISCGSSKNSASTEQQTAPPTASADEASPATSGNTSTTATAQTPMNENSQSPEKQAATKYRLIISFISIGEGTDSKAREKMDANLAKWESKSGKKITFEAMPWGREGETDFCFMLNELSAADQAALARDMRESFQLHPLVQITEYQESTHKK